MLNAIADSPLAIVYTLVPTDHGDDKMFSSYRRLIYGDSLHKAAALPLFVGFLRSSRQCVRWSRRFPIAAHRPHLFFERNRSPALTGLTKP